MNTTSMLYSYKGWMKIFTPEFYVRFRDSVEYYRDGKQDDNYFKHLMLLANKEPIIGVSL